MAEPIENNATNTTGNNVLDGIQSKVGDNGNVTTDGIYSYEPTASAGEIAAMNAPSLPDLKPQDYFPDLNERTLQGTYSGPTIGTVSLFAPGGGLTPYTVIDAREKALEAAALKKAKQIEDFNKLYGEPPVTKHSSVQKELNKVYFEALNKWITNSQKKYGDNWAQALKNDVNFQRNMRDLNTLKEQEDYLVGRIATMEKEIESGKFVASPELQKAMADFRSGISGLAKGAAYTQGYDLNQSILNLETQYELNKLVEDAAKNIEYKITEDMKYAGATEDYDIIKSIRKKQVDPKELEQAAKLVEQQAGLRLTTEQKAQILPMLKRKFAGEEEITVQTPGKAKRSASEEFNYEEQIPETGYEINADGGAIYFEEAYSTNKFDSSAQLDIALSSDMKDTQGKGLEKKTGFVKGTVQSAGNMPYDKVSKKYLSPQEVKTLKDNNNYYGNKNIELKPVAIFNVSPMEGAKGIVGAQNTIIMPIKHIKGKLINTRKKGNQQDFDDKLKEIQSKSEKGVTQSTAADVGKVTNKQQTQKYSADIEKKIQAVLNANPGSTREDVVNALRQAGKLK